MNDAEITPTLSVTAAASPSLTTVGRWTLRHLRALGLERAQGNEIVVHDPGRLTVGASRVLVVTSATLKDQWMREIARHTRSRAFVVSGGAASRRAALESDAPYKILNYELTWRELSLLESLDADVLILDEAQRAKNFRARTAATLRAITSRYLFVLTGTPVENRLDDLYSLLQLVDPEVLGPLWKFKFYYHQQGPRGRVEGYKNLSRLRIVTSSVVLRRRKEEVLMQLPPLTEQTRYIALSAAAVAGLLAGAAPVGHPALVAAIYRALIPAARLPSGAHAPLAKLHDLASLDAAGVEVDEALAREAVAEATVSVERLVV